MTRNTSIGLAVAATLACMIGGPALAQSTQADVGTIYTTAANFCPYATLEADGRTLNIAEYEALYTLYGTTYGGDGVNTFGVPDLRGRVAVGVGTGPGLSNVAAGEMAGVESVTLTLSNMPAHTHTAYLRGVDAAGDTTTLIGHAFANSGTNRMYDTVVGANYLNASAIALGSAGLGQPMGIRNPYLGLRNCIVTDGIYPSHP